MENLMIEGSVKINKDTPYISIVRVISGLITIDFEGASDTHYAFSIDNMHLWFHIEGLVSADTVTKIEKHLDKLSRLISTDSRIFINHERWEMNVILWCLSCSSKPIVPFYTAPRRDMSL